MTFLRGPLIGFLSLFLLVSLGILVELTKKPICLDSSLVAKIERWSTQDVATAYACQRSKWIPYDEIFEQKLPEIAKKLHPLELLLETHLSPSSPWINIVWLENSKNSLRLLDQKIFLSQDLLWDPLTLSDSVARLWIRHQSPGGHLEKSVLEGAFAHLFNLEAGLTNPHLRPWLNSVRTDSQGYLLVGSISKPLGDALFLGLRDLSVGEVTSIRHELIQYISSFTTETLSESDTSATLQELSVKIENIFLQLGSNTHSHSEAWLHWIEQSHALMPPFQNQFQSLVKIGPDLESQLTDFVQTFQDRESLQKPNIIFESNSKVWLGGGSEPLPISSVQAAKAFQLVYLSCRQPLPAIIDQLKSQADHLLIGKHCGPLEKLVFAGLLRGGIGEFAKDNPELSFVLMHTGSLPKESPETYQILNSVNSKQWGNPALLDIGWQAPQWDEQIRAFRARSVIDAVESFR